MKMLLVVALAAAVTATAGLAAPVAAPTLKASTSRYGRVLFDGKGHVLYAFTRDRRGKSRCYGECARAWPVYYTSRKLVAGKGIKRSLLGTTKRRSGRLQVTYAGRPLYYYVGDRSPGEISCQNAIEFGGTWLVVRPSGELVR